MSESFRVSDQTIDAAARAMADVGEAWDSMSLLATAYNRIARRTVAAVLPSLVAEIREQIASEIEDIPTRYGSGSRRDVNRVIGEAAAIARGEWRKTGRGIGLAGGSAHRIIRDDGISDNNADLVVAAVNSLPSLLVLVGQLQEQLDAVRALHKPAQWYSDPLLVIPSDVRCDNDDQEWPCETTAALAAAVLAGRKENHDAD